MSLIMSSKKAVVSIGLVIGALGLAATASALGAAEDPGAGEPTTTVEGPTTSQVPTTAGPTDTSEPTTTTTTTTIEEPVTTEAPVTTLPPPTTVAPEAASNAFGQCTAFSGRTQPGNSQAWQRLYDTAGGDIEGYCAEILAAHGDDLASEQPVEQPAGERSDDPEPDSGADVTHNGNGRDNGTGNGHDVETGRGRR